MSRRGFTGAAFAFVLTLFAACGGPSRISDGLFSVCPPESDVCGVARTEQPEATVFLVGDAGYVEFAQNPVLQHLKERIVALTDQGIAVTAVFLGDNVYDVGVRDGHPEDARLLAAQVETVRGTSARGVFLAGNHDWANHSDSLVMMQRQSALLDGFRDSIPTADVALRPAAGCPGPDEVAVRSSDGSRVATIVAIDSQWWLTQPPVPATCASASGAEAATALRASLVSAPEGPIIVAAHHPLRTGGPHGGVLGGLRGVFYRTGLSSQEVNAGVYRSYVRDVESAIREASSGTVITAAGHDHSLQIHRRTEDDRTWHQIVSGSASKLSEVGVLESATIETLFAAMLPGYVRLDIHEGGSVEVTVIAGCLADDPSRRGDRMREGDHCDGASTFRPAYRSTIEPK